MVVATATQYDNIWAQYNDFRQLPIASVEEATVRANIGDISQLRVLDLACGTGFYSRKLLEWGAREVVGVDISQAMVDDANQRSKGDNRIQFQVGDCTKPLDLGKFDIVLAGWLLNYSANEEEHLEMWRNISNNLKPGGRCLGVVPNHDYLTDGFPKEPVFGIGIKPLEPVKGGWKFQVTAQLQNPCTFTCYSLGLDVYDRCAMKAGIRDVEYMPAIDSGHPDIDFEKFVKAPHFKMFTGVRG
ncbi:hypothetical protein FQN54_008886 [Arachnomyces sp. PD_36]|nr:hypothetical protein FQN54_008886 [Arachnomyces sp. PD_36]